MTQVEEHAAIELPSQSTHEFWIMWTEGWPAEGPY